MRKWLSEEAILDIQRDDRKTKEIADTYGVTATTVYRVKQGKTGTRFNKKPKAIPSEKVCLDCGELKSIEQFAKYKRNNRKHVTPYKPRCKLCDDERRRAYDRGRPQEVKDREAEKARATRRANKWQFIEKMGGECQDCHNTFPMCVYDFHHLDPNEKDIEPGFLFHRRLDVIEQELAKCILLCANCHRIRHNESPD
jgi:hypothetical protein